MTRREETHVVVKNRENEANQLYRRFREQRSRGVVMLTITPRENDHWDETRTDSKTAKAKPINCIDSSESGDRRARSSRRGSNAS
jgi:hypothetical protein